MHQAKSEKVINVNNVVGGNGGGNNKAHSKLSIEPVPCLNFLTKIRKNTVNLIHYIYIYIYIYGIQNQKHFLSSTFRHLSFSYIYIYTYIYICTYIYIHAYTYIHIYIYTYIHIHIYMYSIVYIVTFTYIHLIYWKLWIITTYQAHNKWISTSIMDGFPFSICLTSKFLICPSLMSRFQLSKFLASELPRSISPLNSGLSLGTSQKGGSQFSKFILVTLLFEKQV